MKVKLENPGAKKPTFFWQAVLIILPLILLVGIGVYSLRQDRIMAETEAKERAQAIADDLHGKIWEELHRNNGFVPSLTNSAKSSTYRWLGRVPLRPNIAFAMSPGCELIFPLPVPPLIPTPAHLDKLNEDQKNLWQAASLAEFRHSDPSAATSAYHRFLSSNPPEEFAARAEFALGLLAEKEDLPATKNNIFHRQTVVLPAAKNIFDRLAANHPTATSDAGFSLALLARLKSLQIVFTKPTPDIKVTDPPDDFCRDAVLEPTPLTDTILDVFDQWVPPGMPAGMPAEYFSHPRIIWNIENISRDLYAKARKMVDLGPPKSSAFSLLAPGGSSNDFYQRFPAFLWLAGKKLGHFGQIGEGEENYLAMTKLSGSNLWFLCQSEQALHHEMDAVLQKEKYLPDYFGVSIEIAGRAIFGQNIQLWSEIHHFGRKGGTTKKSFATVSSNAVAVTNNDDPLSYEFPDAKADHWYPTPSAIIATSHAADPLRQMLKVNIHLSSPAALYKRQTMRTFWFGGLILISTLAALTGLAGAYRSFRQQTRLSKMKTNFVSSVSHELRAPVASMRLMAEALDRGKISDAPKQKEYFRFIVQECRRLSSLVENILDFSRIEQGRKEYEFEPTDLQALAEQTVKLMEPYAAERQVKVQISHSSLSTPHSSLSLDGLALQQALINLIDNAIKHSPANATITIGMESHATTVHLWVEDHGPGIPLEEHEKIFQRFYRLGSELRRETQGIGIGLAIVKHIVTAHQGRVLVKSAPGQGSRFTIELPLGKNREN